MFKDIMKIDSIQKLVPVFIQRNNLFIDFIEIRRLINKIPMLFVIKVAGIGLLLFQKSTEKKYLDPVR